MKYENKQYTCPECKAVGAGPSGPYLCHVCKYEVIMCLSHNGFIIDRDPEHLKDINEYCAKIKVADGQSYKDNK